MNLSAILSYLAFCDQSLVALSVEMGAPEDAAWETYKSRTREDQALVEGLLRELRTVSRDVEERPVMVEIQGEIEARIVSLTSLVQKMAELARGSPARTAQVHRLRELPGVWQAEIARIREVADREIARAQILGRPQSSRATATQEETLFKERSHLLSALGGAEQSVSMASEAQRMIRDQTRRTIAATEKLGTIASKFPGINGLMQKIKNKQFRDELILAAVIALCLFWIFVKIAR
jgi:hypothetical protein